MDWFSVWWGGLGVVERVLYCIAIPSSVFLILQSILIVVGGDGDSGDSGDGDFDYASGAKDFGVASMFSIQGVASFLCAFGWGSILLIQMGVLWPFAMVAAFMLGVGVMFAIAKVMYYLSKLAHCGTLDVENLIGNTGSVYLTIPPKGEGKGKVMVQTSERLVEFDAVGVSEDAIANNVTIKVVDILAENVLVVEKQEVKL
jgi:hypothetical protein